MTTVIRNYQEGEMIPDAHHDTSYTFEELDGGLYLANNEITGAEVYHLTNGKTVVIQSIDLDWVEPYEDKVLRTTSLPYLGKCYICTENIWLRADEVDGKLVCTNCVH